MRHVSSVETYGGSWMRLIRTAVLGAILLFLLWMIVAAILSYFDVTAVPKDAVPNTWRRPDSWAEWRDIVIVLTAGFWVIAGVLMIALMVALLFLALLVRRVLKENAVPA